MAENYYSLLGEGFTRAAQLRSRDEKKQMKKAMKYQLLYGLGGQFLGDLISTPFKEPVKRFFNMEAGRQVKAKQTHALSDLDRLQTVESDLTRTGGEGGPVQGLVNVYMENVDNMMSAPDWFGPEWEKGPNAHVAASWRTSVEPRVREQAEKEVTELRNRIQELSLTPSDKRLAELAAGAKILSPNAGVGAGRWLMERFGGKSKGDRMSEGVNYILTGDSPDLKDSAWARAATQAFINKSDRAAELYNPDFIRDTFEEIKSGMMYQNGRLTHSPELSQAWDLLDATQQLRSQTVADSANVASKLTTSPARSINRSGYDEVAASLFQELGRIPTEAEVDEGMTVQSKGMDMNNTVVSNLIDQLHVRSEMVEIRDRLRDDLAIKTASEIRRPGVNREYYNAPKWQQAIIDNHIDSTYRGWLQLSSSTYHSARLKAISDEIIDETFVGDDADVNIQEALMYGVQRIGEDYLTITNQDKRNTIVSRILDKLDMPIQDPIRTGSVSQTHANLLTGEMVDLVSGSDQEKVRERAKERLENRNVGQDGEDNSNSLVEHLYGDDGSTAAQRRGPSMGRVNIVPTNDPKTVDHLAKIRTHWQNGESTEALNYTHEFITRMESDTGESWRMPSEFIELEGAFMDPEGQAQMTKQERTEGIRERFRDQARDPVDWGRDLPAFPPEHPVGEEIRDEIKFETPKTDEESSFNNFVDLLYDEEGFRTNVYKDTKGKLTVGLGHLLTPSEVERYNDGDLWTDEDLLAATRKDTDRMWKATKSQAQELGIDDNDFIVSLGSANFNLGESWFKDHDKTWAALKAGDYEEAISEITDSDWYRNRYTNNRAVAFQRAIRKLMDAQSPSLLRKPDPEHRSISMFGI